MFDKELPSQGKLEELKGKTIVGFERGKTPFSGPEDLIIHFSDNTTFKIIAEELDGYKYLLFESHDVGKEVAWLE